MTMHATSIMIGVDDVARSKQFYADGLGARVEQDYGHFVLLDLGERSSSLALYQREAAAQDAGVPSAGSGFRAVSFHCIVDSREEVDGLIGKALAAGGTEVKAADGAQWGYFGYFADPDGFLWKVASSN
jgi:catechol 2,3-dioxygenase-like lactoylglutathione lyase family enzyme